MCLAIVVDKHFDAEEVDGIIEGIDNAWDDNPDGAGMSYVDEGKRLVVDKGHFDKSAFIEEVKKVLNKNYNSDILIHLRYASAGVINKENCHPFRIDDSKALIHNGTIRQMGAKKEDDESDTVKFSKFLSTLPKDFMEHNGYDVMIEDYLGFNKVCVLSDDGESKIYNSYKGEMIGNVWYSNDYYKKTVVRKDNKSSKKEEQRSSEGHPYHIDFDGNWVPNYEVDACYVCDGMLELDEEKEVGICTKCMNNY